MMMEPITSFSTNPYTIQEWKEKFIPIYSGLAKSLPKNVHLLTMETTGNQDEIILRLEHFFEKGEDPVLSRPVLVSLRGLFKDFTILSVTEMNLSANQFLKDKKMMKWNTNNRFNDKSNSIENDLIHDMNIILKPMQIRTFILKIKRK